MWERSVCGGARLGEVVGAAWSFLGDRRKGRSWGGEGGRVGIDCGERAEG